MHHRFPYSPPHNTFNAAIFAHIFAMFAHIFAMFAHTFAHIFAYIFVIFATFANIFASQVPLLTPPNASPAQPLNGLQIERFVMQTLMSML